MARSTREDIKPSSARSRVACSAAVASAVDGTSLSPRAQWNRSRAPGSATRTSPRETMTAAALCAEETTRVTKHTPCSWKRSRASLKWSNAGTSPPGDATSSWTRS